MTKSKRKRQGGVFARTIPEEDLGENWRENFVQQTIEYYKSEQNKLFQDFNSISGGINSLPYGDKFYLHKYHQRSILIESLIILDKNISSILMQVQIRVLKMRLDKLFSVDKNEDYINAVRKKCNIKFSSELDKVREKIKHFRTLRNQFAHSQYGIFMLDAQKESFESFLKNDVNFNLGNSHWAMDNEKAHFVLPYQITNSDYMHLFGNLSVDYLNLLGQEFLIKTKK